MGDMTVDELKDKKLWFLWSAKPGRNGKVTKVPFAANGGATGTDDAHKGTWVSFDDAESARNQFQASGIGLKIPKGFFLLDIDHKDISDPFAQLMLSRFSSYAEVSPSGKGIHIIGQCDITKLPVHFDDRRKRLVLDSEYYQKCSDIGLELYIGDITNRYGTFTGNTINSLSIADCTQAVLTTLDKEMRKSRKRSIVQSVMEIGQYLILSVIFVSRRTETSSSGFMIKVISVNMVPSLRRMLPFVL